MKILAIFWQSNNSILPILVNILILQPFFSFSVYLQKCLRDFYTSVSFYRGKKHKPKQIKTKSLTISSLIYFFNEFKLYVRKSTGCLETVKLLWNMSMQTEKEASFQGIFQANIWNGSLFTCISSPVQDWSSNTAGSC